MEYQFNLTSEICKKICSNLFKWLCPDMQNGRDCCQLKSISLNSSAESYVGLGCIPFDSECLGSVF